MRYIQLFVMFDVFFLLCTMSSVRLNVRVVCIVSTNVSVWQKVLMNCNVVCNGYVCKYVMFVFYNDFDSTVCYFLTNASLYVCGTEWM